MAHLILYDLPSRGRCACWSLNPWKTRMALNYKGLDYTTEWTEYPDIAPKFKSFGLQPNDAPGATPYTIPTLRFDDKTVVMDSKKIAKELEERYPEPSLHLDAPILAEIEGLVPKIYQPLRAFWMPSVPEHVLNPRSMEYFERTRSETVGMSTAEYRKRANAEECWAQAEPALKRVADLLMASGGPFFEGKQVGYADFVFITVLEFWRRVDRALFDRALALDAAFKTLHDACAKWLERDDY